MHFRSMFCSPVFDDFTNAFEFVETSANGELSAFAKLVAVIAPVPPIFTSPAFVTEPLVNVHVTEPIVTVLPFVMFVVVKSNRPLQRRLFETKMFHPKR